MLFITAASGGARGRGTAFPGAAVRQEEGARLAEARRAHKAAFFAERFGTARFTKRRNYSKIGFTVKENANHVGN